MYGNVCRHLISVDSIANNDPAALTALQEYLLPHVPVITELLWILWGITLATALYRIVVRPLWAKRAS
jgi:hypothetical protein